MRNHGEGNSRLWYSFLLNMALIILLFFSSVFAGLYLSNQKLIQEELESRARAFFQSILTTRSWNARHGGVFVEKVPGIASNPYLENPDITSTEGKTYTKKNPALMTREISEMARGKGYFEYHITSLKPLNPENTPNVPERAALQKFEQGVKEVFNTRHDDGDTYYWYMAPLYTERACLQCHEKQGYKVGDVRGGISVKFNIDAVQKRLNQTRWVTVFLFALSSLVLLVIVYRLVHGLMQKIAEAQERLQKIATTDSLTGLYNRRYLDDRLGNEIQRAIRYQYPLSCVMFDIDHFKRINDTYGHDAGDKVLVTLARQTHKFCRESDILARYGGEEFVLILPNTGCNAAFAVAEKLRNTIAEKHIYVDKEISITVTASFGVVELQTGAEAKSIDYSSLISAADAALYSAKRSGRNRTVVA
jgi:diguanylate cyclase (GGDEF)-like protein